MLFVSVVVSKEIKRRHYFWSNLHTTRAKPAEEARLNSTWEIRKILYTIIPALFIGCGTSCNDLANL